MKVRSTEINTVITLEIYSRHVRRTASDSGEGLERDGIYTVTGVDEPQRPVNCELRDKSIPALIMSRSSCSSRARPRASVPAQPSERAARGQPLVLVERGPQDFVEIRRLTRHRGDIRATTIIN